MEAKIYFFGGWGGVVGEVGNKANTAQLVVGVKVGAELGKNRQQQETRITIS